MGFFAALLGKHGLCVGFGRLDLLAEQMRDFFLKTANGNFHINAVALVFWQDDISVNRLKTQYLKAIGGQFNV